MSNRWNLNHTCSLSWFVSNLAPNADSPKNKSPFESRNDQIQQDGMVPSLPNGVSFTNQSLVITSLKRKREFTAPQNNVKIIYLIQIKLNT